MSKIKGQKWGISQKNKKMLLGALMFLFTILSYYKSAGDATWKIIAVLGIVTIGLSIYDEKNQKVQMEKERMDFFRRKYPVLAANVSLLLQSGMSPKGTFLYLEKEYSQEDLLKVELQNLKKKLNAGYSEKLAYKEFGQACMTREYSRLMSLIIQYLEQGTRHISVLLELEMRDAYAMRLRLMRQAGEEMSTKMLVPLGLLLLDVMAIVIAPIMMAMNSLQGL